MGFSSLLIKHLLVVLPLSILHLYAIAQSDPSDPIRIRRRERDALYSLKATFNNSFLNVNWTGPQCYKEWYGIRCIHDRVTEVSLESMGLNGSVGSDALVFLTELTVLSFKNNSISGNVMDFSSNKKMQQIDLSANKLSGSISESLLSLEFLELLLLQDNNLTGPIPKFNQSSLKDFNISNNNLEGSVPETKTLQSFGLDSYSGNSRLCGPPTHNGCSFRKNVLADTNESSPDPPPKRSSKPNFATMFILFDIVGLVAVVLLFVLYFRKVKKLKKMIKQYNESKKEDGNDCDVREKEEVVEEEGKSVMSIEVQGRSGDFGEQQKGKQLVFMDDETDFELNDLLKASAQSLGTGNFGNCYKAKMDGRPAVVVKRIRDLKPLSSEEFTRQLHVIADQKHPNLLPLLAYYYSNGEKLLVYKYAENGNLFDRIHGRRGNGRIPFRWSARLSVARGVARAMEYLHLNNISQSIVPHGNLKSSNVLLNSNEMVLVTDYGLTSLIAQPIAAQRLVSYKSPEYQATKRVSKKSDVWSYGSLLLEILTGRVSIHSAPPGTNGVDLFSRVHRVVREEWTAEIFDTEISANRNASPGMLKLLKIAMRCCDKSPDNRPEIAEVVREVENIRIIESEDEDESLTDESRSTSASMSIKG